MDGLSFLMHIYVFVLAIFVGFELITKVPPTLHTPLMSGSNAISGITIVGALLSAGLEQFTISTILGIKYLGSPKTARKGNLFASIGMLMAIVITLFDQHVLTFEWIIIGVIIGSTVGVILAVKVPMTGMPQMVGMLNGFGGGASTLV